MKRFIACFVLSTTLGLSACAGQTPTQQRTLSGAAIGAVGGSAIGAIAGNAGLGLAIAQGIVTDHRGRIEVTSRAGKGSTFRVIFPLA